jgi:hypothetical protein
MLYLISVLLIIGGGKKILENRKATSTGQEESGNQP